MRILADSNILVCLAHPAHREHETVLGALARLRQDGNELCVVPQNIYEFWVVATRPIEQNGLGMPTANTQNELTRIRRLFTTLLDERAILGEWERLVVANDVKGKSAHDARLAAAMLRHGLTQILTMNTEDFRRFREIKVLTPNGVKGETGG